MMNEPTKIVLSVTAAVFALVLFAYAMHWAVTKDKHDAEQKELNGRANCIKHGGKITEVHHGFNPGWRCEGLTK